MYAARIVTVSLALMSLLADARHVVSAEESSPTPRTPDIRLRLEVLDVSMTRVDIARSEGVVDNQALPFPCRDIVGWYSEELLNGNDELKVAESLRAFVDDIRREGCCKVRVDQSIDISSGQSIATFIADGSPTQTELVVLANPTTVARYQSDAKQLGPGKTMEGTTAVLMAERVDSNRVQIKLEVSDRPLTAAGVSGSTPVQTPSLQTLTRQSTRCVANGGVLAMSGRKRPIIETRAESPWPLKIGPVKLPIGRTHVKTVKHQIETIILVTPSLATSQQPATR